MRPPALRPKYLLLFSALISILCAFPLAAQTVLSTDFSKDDVKGYDNAATIGIGGDPSEQLTANSGIYDGATGLWGPPAAGTNPQAAIAVNTDGKHAVQLSPGTAISKDIPDAVAHMEPLQLQGTVVFTILGSAANPQERTSAVMILTKDKWFSTGGSNLFFMELSTSLAFKFNGGYVPQTLTAGQKYRVDFTVDGSDAQQHTWQFTLYEGDGTDKPVFASPQLKTRNPTAGPNTFLIHQYGGIAGTDPLLEIDKVSLSVPALGKTPAAAPAKTPTPAPAAAAPSNK